MVSDLLLFPHCDLHVSLAHAPKLKIDVRRRQDGANPGDPYIVGAAPLAGACQFDFFAPDLAAGHRFDNLPAVAPDGTVTATAVGRYLFQVRFTIGAAPNQRTHYLVGSLQVHADILGWWFGNSSITTALDATIGHAQPSIYARFSDDAGTGTDLVGDITGHGYVPITSADTGRVVVMPNGRLRGVTEGSTTVTGTFLGLTSDPLTVKVVDYRKPSQALAPVQTSNVADFANRHNVVFLAEGFTAAQQPRFDELVTHTVGQLYEAPRHQPYGLLKDRFNNFKVFSQSTEDEVTVGYRVMDQDAGPVLKGRMIPFEEPYSSKTTTMAVHVLVAKVGLPRRGESSSRADLLADWRSKNRISAGDEPNIDETLIEVWKGQRSSNILDARDTFFGMILGSRPGDRSSDLEGAPVVRPPTDAPGATLDAFVSRVYEYFTFPVARQLVCDPRRHPPELYAGDGEPNPQCSIMRFIAAQSYMYDPSLTIGLEWIPDQTKRKPSRGLVALVANDHVIGGTNLNDRSITAQTVARDSTVDVALQTSGNVTRLRRNPPPFAPDRQILPNNVAHEFGHSFALGDEYEVTDKDDPNANKTFDYAFDNLTRLGVIRLAPEPARDLDPAKVKWLGLPRIAVSSRLTQDSVAQGGGIDARIDPHWVGIWKEVQAQGKEVVLRAPDLTPRGQQLPLKADPLHELRNLRVTQVDEATGLIKLGGPGLPASPGTFAAGSLIYSPKLDGAMAKKVGEQAVFDFIKKKKIPLNVDPNHDKASAKFDNPVEIEGFRPPCNTSRLVGVYEGGAGFAGGVFRPAGQCKMRKSAAPGRGEGAFCFVCMWLIVNNVDPGMHAALDFVFFPRAKVNG